MLLANLSFLAVFEVEFGSFFSKCGWIQRRKLARLPSGPVLKNLRKASECDIVFPLGLRVWMIASNKNGVHSIAGGKRRLVMKMKMTVLAFPVLLLVASSSWSEELKETFIARNLSVKMGLLATASSNGR